MSTWVKAGKKLLDGKQKKLTKIFGDVVLAKTDHGYIARFEKDVRVPAYGESIMYTKLHSSMVKGELATQAAAVRELFRLLEASGGRPALIKDQMSEIESNMRDDLIKDGFKAITLPRPK